MLTNYHTHTNFCDGNNSAEDMVISAINKGFSSIGFSGHAKSVPAYDYCIKDTLSYVNEINRLKDKYKREIQIYLGIEDDAIEPTDQNGFDYIIGSSHHIFKDGKFYSIDADTESFKECVDAFDGNIMSLSENYYEVFCNYLKLYKPDIIGHFDLITKFDEINGIDMLNNPQYKKIARHYIEKAMKYNLIFEINTGAISRGYRSTPYPSIDLLRTLFNGKAKIMLSSDSHDKNTLDYNFTETVNLLKEIGFKKHWILYDGKFTQIDL